MFIDTHIITGCALATTVMRAQGRPTTPELVAIGCGAAASVVPDIDVFFRPLGDEPSVQGLTYLLYHRGWTHTVIGCLGLAASTVAIVLVVLALIGQVTGRPAEKLRPAPSRLLLIAVLGALLHLTMDATNDYGVHPFWPVWDGWIYGDFIFLAEPLITGSMVALMLQPLLRDWGSTDANRAPTIIAIVLALGAIGFIWWRAVINKHWITGPAAAVATIWIVPLLVLAKFRPSLRRPWVAMVAVWLVFLAGSQRVKGEVSELLRGKQERTITVTTTPAAANPFCWRVVTSGISASGEVTGRLGVVSLWPSVTKPDTCLRELVPATLALAKADLDQSDSHHWVGTFRAPLSKFQEYAEQNRRVRATTHTLRAPYWQRSQFCGGQILLGDLRLDYEKRLDRYGKYCFDPEVADKRDPPPSPWIPPFFDRAEGK